MADWQILSITGAVIVGIVLLIIKVRLNPVVALIIGALTLGVSTGMTPGETTDTVMTGFGDIMYEIGLLIVWGVLLGSILNRSGAIARLVDKLLSMFGKRGVPYALGVTIGAGLQAIFLDVLLVMSAPSRAVSLECRTKRHWQNGCRDGYWFGVRHCSDGPRRSNDGASWVARCSSWEDAHFWIHYCCSNDRCIYRHHELCI